MTVRIPRALSHALGFSGALAGVVGPAEAQSPLPPVRGEFRLNCRGGAGLVFDTLLLISDSGRVRLMLTFAANAAASGVEGQGLEPGACAWVDRPLTDAEPRRIQFAIGTTDSAPAQTVRDSGMYWGFLVYTADSGSISGVGYRHWHRSSARNPHVPPAAAADTADTADAAETGAMVSAGRRSFPLPFDVRYLPLFALGMAVIPTSMSRGETCSRWIPRKSRRTSPVGEPGPTTRRPRSRRPENGCARRAKPYGRPIRSSWTLRRRRMQRRRLSSRLSRQGCLAAHRPISRQRNRQPSTPPGGVGDVAFAEVCGRKLYGVSVYAKTGRNDVLVSVYEMKGWPKASVRPAAIALAKAAAARAKGK